MTKNILIADDSPITQNQLSRLLKNAGYNILGIAMNGMDAVNLHKENKEIVDLITLDITMPLMDGVQALEKILIEKPDANVIMVSAMGKQKIIQKCLTLGAKNFITKPFKKEKVLQTVKYLIA